MYSTAQLFHLLQWLTNAEQLAARDVCEWATSPTSKAFDTAIGYNALLYMFHGWRGLADTHIMYSPPQFFIWVAKVDHC
jgi:hypothetical protein